MEQLKIVNALLMGVRWRGELSHERVRFVTGEEILLEVVGSDFLQSFKAAGSSPIAQTELDEIVAFLYNAGQNWKRRDYIRRTVYERNLIKYLGYSSKAATTEADWVALFLCSSFRLFDILSVELGGWQLMDNWVAREEALVRAFP
ncbi:MAG: hypothetical protein C5B54_01550, partial [Acidobacteria bacterium]